MNRKQITGLIAATAAGLASAVALALPATASAYTPDQLPNMGYRVIETNLGNNCHDWQASGYGASADLGSDCDPGFQAALDDFVNRTCPCAQTTTATTQAAPPPTTTDTATTPAASPVTDPPPTTAATTTQADPTPAPPTTTDTAAPTPAPPAAPGTTTSTDTTAAAIADLQARIAALEAEIQALSARVDRIALAGDASWLAFQQAVAGGSTIADAADIARGTYLDAEYGLGAFAA